jgi:hypothetical protein
MGIKQRMIDISQKICLYILQMLENVCLFADLHSEVAKFADFYVDIKFVDMQTECYSKIVMTLSQRGQCILLSVVLPPSPPARQPRQYLGPTPTCHLSTLN